MIYQSTKMDGDSFKRINLINIFLWMPSDDEFLEEKRIECHARYMIKLNGISQKRKKQEEKKNGVQGGN